MGCVLGPTFANFYMGYLEELIFTNFRKPKVYCRYVDDIFIVTENVREIINLKEKFEECSVLKLTYELEKDKNINFLDVHIEKNGEKFETSVYRKDTNDGSCLNFNSICPFRYKTGVIKTLLHRAYIISSTWENLHKELERIKQLLINNNFPIQLIDNTIKNFLNAKFKVNETSSNKNTNINLYFQN